MSIYRRGFDFEYIWSKGKPILLMVVVAVVVVLAGITYLVLSMMNQPVLEAELMQSAIKSSEHTLLSITVSNYSETDIRDVIVHINAADNQAIDVSPGTVEIPVLEKDGGNRNLEILVNPIGEVLPGKYTLRIEAEMGDAVHNKEVIIEIVR